MSDASPVLLSGADVAPVAAPAKAPAELPPEVPPHLEWLTVESLDLEAQGVAHRANGKVVFIEDALPGEEVRVSVSRRKNNWEQATPSERRRESSQRTQPRCVHFGLCGGCKMQHFQPAAQVAVKQRVLEDNLWHLGKVRAETLLRPIEGPTWGYRYRARLSVRHVVKKGTVLVGFHERKSRYVADMRAFAAEHGPVGSGQHTLSWWLQPKGPDTVHPLDESLPKLDYTLPEFGINMPFRPTDFTQVNHATNPGLVGRAWRLLAVKPQERVIDWFCGLGNFTLPLATQAREVLGIEGSEALVARSHENYALNQAVAPDHKALAATDFVARNLFEMTPEMLVADGSADKWLVDPPREGAFALAKALADIEQARIGAEGAGPLPTGAEGWAPPKRIGYVSCTPATLARDAGLLVHLAGYRCTAAGMVNMFPHTAHVESMAVFERD